MAGSGSTQKAGAFGFAKFLSWSSFVIILVSGLFLSIIIANEGRKTLLTKQQSFALLLAENLNHQIYRRFTLPTLIGFGRIPLDKPAVRERLEQVVLSTIHGWKVQEFRIYGYDKAVIYSTDESLIGKQGLSENVVTKALDKGEHTFVIKSRIPQLLAMFSPLSKPGSVVLKTVYPLRAERELQKDGAKSVGHIMGVMEFSQDITDDYKTVVRFQWLIIGLSLILSVIMFLVLLTVIRRAERLQIERIAEKEELEKEIHQSERLASMGRVVAGIAHEIRNPLGIIRSTAELLLKNPSGVTEATPRLIRAIHDESKRLSQTVNDFLDYARPKEPKKEPVDVAGVLDQAMTFLEGECAKRNVVIEKKYDSGLIIQGDKDFLYRCFYNIIINAVQAMKESGKITIDSEVLEDHFNLVFQDTGPGFDLRYSDKLRDPFFTTKDSGTGLGLTIVDNIIKGHDGEIELKNGKNGGAVVRLRFKTYIPNDERK